MSDLWREVQRKTFHMLSLAYLAAYQLIGYPRVLKWMLVWSAIVTVVETARLYLPRMNKGLIDFFSGLARPEEYHRISGIFHTTIGALILILGFGSRPRIVAASLFYVALGDAAAALVGKRWGSHRLPGSRKTIEGSLGCFLACVLVGVVMGFSPAPVALAALTATVIELLPTTAFFNDNLWMPVGTAVILRLLV